MDAQEMFKVFQEEIKKKGEELANLHLGGGLNPQKIITIAIAMKLISDAAINSLEESEKEVAKVLIDSMSVDTKITKFRKI